MGCCSAQDIIRKIEALRDHVYEELEIPHLKEEITETTIFTDQNHLSKALSYFESNKALQEEQLTYLHNALNKFQFTLMKLLMFYQSQLLQANAVEKVPTKQTAAFKKQMDILRNYFNENNYVSQQTNVSC